MVEYKNSPPKKEDHSLFFVNFFEKTSKKVLTMKKRYGIIVKLSARAGGAWSLKIEQQEISAKHCKCEKLNLVKELYILETK